MFITKPCPNCFMKKRTQVYVWRSGRRGAAFGTAGVAFKFGKLCNKLISRIERPRRAVTPQEQLLLTLITTAPDEGLVGRASSAGPPSAVVG